LFEIANIQAKTNPSHAISQLSNHDDKNMV